MTLVPVAGIHSPKNKSKLSGKARPRPFKLVPKMTPNAIANLPTQESNTLSSVQARLRSDANLSSPPCLKAISEKGEVAAEFRRGMLANLPQQESNALSAVQARLRSDPNLSSPPVLEAISEEGQITHARRGMLANEAQGVFALSDTSGATIARRRRLRLLDAIVRESRERKMRGPEVLVDFDDVDYSSPAQPRTRIMKAFGGEEVGPGTIPSFSQRTWVERMDGRSAAYDAYERRRR